jgi:formylglycine-generating enzyme required for sulfatase activity
MVNNMKIGAARIATLWILFMTLYKASLHGDEVGSVVRVDKGVGATPSPRLEQVNLGEGVALEMVLVPPGSFKMGAGQLQSGTDKKVRDVKITKPF